MREVLLNNQKQAKVFKHLHQYFQENWVDKQGVDPLAFQYIVRKGVYPYSFCSNFDVFNTTSLPEQKAFKNDLKDKDINEEDYEHAQRVWSAFKCQTFADYSKLYLETDTLLLSDVMELFRASMRKEYNLGE